MLNNQRKGALKPPEAGMPRAQLECPVFLPGPPAGRLDATECCLKPLEASMARAQLDHAGRSGSLTRAMGSMPKRYRMHGKGLSKPLEADMVRAQLDHARRSSFQPRSPAGDLNASVCKASGGRHGQRQHKLSKIGCNIGC